MVYAIFEQKDSKLSLAMVKMLQFPSAGFTFFYIRLLLFCAGESQLDIFTVTGLTSCCLHS